MTIDTGAMLPTSLGERVVTGGCPLLRRIEEPGRGWSCVVKAEGSQRVVGLVGWPRSAPAIRGNYINTNL